jgi:hypothetical protein
MAYARIVHAISAIAVFFVVVHPVIGAPICCYRFVGI